MQKKFVCDYIFLFLHLKPDFRYLRLISLSKTWLIKVGVKPLKIQPLASYESYRKAN